MNTRDVMFDWMFGCTGLDVSLDSTVLGHICFVDVPIAYKLVTQLAKAKSSSADMACAVGCRPSCFKTQTIAPSPNCDLDHIDAGALSSGHGVPMCISDPQCGAPALQPPGAPHTLSLITPPLSK